MTLIRRLKELEGNLTRQEAEYLKPGHKVIFSPGEYHPIKDLITNKEYTIKELIRGQNGLFNSLFRLEERDDLINCKWFRLPK